MPGIHDNIRASRPSLVDLGFIQMIVTRTNHIVDRIVLNQFSDKEWLLSEAIVDLFWIYTYCSGDNDDDDEDDDEDDDDDDDVSKHLGTMVEERGNFPDAENLRSNLLEVHSKMRSRVKDNITNVLAPLLQIPAKKTPLLVFSFLGPTVCHGG